MIRALHRQFVRLRRFIVLWLVVDALFTPDEPAREVKQCSDA